MSKTKASQLYCTTDYSLFELHEHNRTLREKPLLLASMQQHGFIPSFPLACQHASNGRLRVLCGHHRLHYAKRLKLPVYYIICNTALDIFTVEGDNSCVWSAKDFADARAKAGNREYQILQSFMRQHCLPLGAAASLCGGENAGNHNKVSLLKSGKFACGDMRHANSVVRITDLCREMGIAFATSVGFVSAVSMILRVPEFDIEVLLHRIRCHPGNMQHRAKCHEYLDELDALYNYGARSKRLPLKFRAIEVCRKRQETFGRHTEQSEAAG